MEVIGQIKSCGKCSRRILVERVMCGINHTLGTIITCWDCLAKNKQIKAKELYKLGGEK